MGPCVSKPQAEDAGQSAVKSNAPGLAQHTLHMTATGGDTPSSRGAGLRHTPPSSHGTLQASGTGLWGSGSLASAVSGLLTSTPIQADSKPGVLTVADFNHEIEDLAFIGAGASGDVYRGRWQGATVAVKYIVSQSSDAQQAATNEAALGRLLAHPNVVQTYSCKTAVLDDEFIRQLNHMLAAPRLPSEDLDGFQSQGEDEQQQGHGQQAAAAAPAMMGYLAQELEQQGQGLHAAGAPAAAADAPAGPSQPVEQQYMSGEGFGNPLGQRQSVLALQEVLLRADAKSGYQLTQIVMEHCDKGSLLQAIHRGLFQPTSRWGPRLALRALLRTAQEVAQGMWHIHQANVIHGDLKPGNVLLKGSRADRRGFVAKVSDFGLSRISEHTTRDSQHWGTVHYMAPETFDGVVARQSDVYSFGITLWQMMTGAKPWQDLHPGQIIVGVQAGSLALEWPDGVHPRLVRLGQSCVEHDRKKRPGFNIIMKELSQIENMVRLQGAILPQPNPTAGSSLPEGAALPDAMSHAATDPEPSRGNARTSGSHTEQLAQRAASCSAMPAAASSVVLPPVYPPGFQVVSQPVGGALVGLGPTPGGTSGLPPVVQVVAAMGNILHATPPGLQLYCTNSGPAPHNLQVYGSGPVPVTLLPAHMAVGPPGSGQQLHVLVAGHNLAGQYAGTPPGSSSPPQGASELPVPAEAVIHNPIFSLVPPSSTSPASDVATPTLVVAPPTMASGTPAGPCSAPEPETTPLQPGSTSPETSPAGDRNQADRGSGGEGSAAVMRRSRLSLASIGPRSSGSGYPHPLVRPLSRGVQDSSTPPPPPTLGSASAEAGPLLMHSWGTSVLQALVMECGSAMGTRGQPLCEDVGQAPGVHSEGHQGMPQVVFPVVSLAGITHMSVRSDSVATQVQAGQLCSSHPGTWNVVGPGSDPSEMSNCVDMVMPQGASACDAVGLPCGSVSSRSGRSLAASTTTSNTPASS